jgi:hypothetical protein
MARAKHAETAGPVSLKRLLPLYAVVFAGFVGYSLMITDLLSWFSDATPFWAAMIVLAMTRSG